MSTTYLVCFRDGTRKTFISSGDLASDRDGPRPELTVVTDDSDLQHFQEAFPAGFVDSRRKAFGSDAIACSDLPPYDPKPYSWAMFILVLIFGVGVAALVIVGFMRRTVP